MSCFTVLSVAPDAGTGKEDKRSDGAGDDGIEIKEREEKKNAVFGVESALLHYIQKVINIKRSNFSLIAHHVHVFETPVNVCRKMSSYVDILSHPRYEEHGGVFERQPW